MDGLLVLLGLGVLWIFLAPFFVMGKTGAAEERLNQRIDELNAKLDALNARTARSWAEDSPVAAPMIPGEFLLLPATETSLPPEESVFRSEALRMDEPAEELPVEFAEEAETPPETPAVADTGSAELSPEPSVSFADAWEENEEENEADSFVEDPLFEGPREPGIISTTLKRLYSWLLAEGNIWVCAGVLLFFVGFGLLFSYAIQFHRVRRFLTLEMRLAAAAATGLLMTGFGFRMREKRRTYALILQGGGMGVLYLVVLAATKFNSISTGLPILPPTAAVGAMLILSVFTVLLALLQDYQPLALFAILGGFVAPVLVSTGSRNHVALFSIYTLLNLEILMLAFRRNWRLLNRMGFLLTVGIGTAWGFKDWRPELFATVEPFLVIFVATYTLITLRTAMRREGGIGDEAAPADASDLLLSVGVAFGFFALQTQVVGHFTYGMALTCLGLGLWYLLWGAWLMRRGERYHPMMSRLFMALCILFSNLVVPYAFEKVASSAIWAIEGAFLIVVACRYGSYKALLGGIVLHIGAMGLYSPELMIFDRIVTGYTSPFLVSGLMFTLAHQVSSFWTGRFRPRCDGPLYDGWEAWFQNFLGSDGAPVRRCLSWIFAVTGSFWFWWTIVDQIPRLAFPLLSAFTVACIAALGGVWMSVRFSWSAGRFLMAGPIVAGFVWAIGVLPPVFRFTYGMVLTSVFEQHLWLKAIAYIGTIGTSLYLLRASAVTFRSKAVWYAAVFTGLTFAREALVQLMSGFNPELVPIFSILPLAGTLLYLSDRREKLFFFAPYQGSLAVATGLLLLCTLPSFAQSFMWKGEAVRGIFIPILNPLELWQGGVMLSIALWGRTFCGERPRTTRFLRWFLPALLFVWANQAAARGTWWYSSEIFYGMRDVLRTAQYQGVIAILWGVLGLAGIMYGQKTRNRLLWRMGAGLLAVDMLKLLLIDLNRAATLTRILAFLVLGGLFLLIGWSAPLPPKATGESEDETNNVTNSETGSADDNTEQGN